MHQLIILCEVTGTSFSKQDFCNALLQQITLKYFFADEIKQSLNRDFVFIFIILVPTFFNTLIAP